MTDQISIFGEPEIEMTLSPEILRAKEARLNYAIHNGKAWMIAIQICHSIGIRETAHLLKKVDAANKIKCLVLHPISNQGKGRIKTRKRWMVNAAGADAIVNQSRKPIARHMKKYFGNWFTQISASGGFKIRHKRPAYIAEKTQSTAARKETTLYLKDFIEYAQLQGSKNAPKYYMIFTKAINRKAGVSHKSQANEIQLHQISTLEAIVGSKLDQMMNEGENYHTAYEQAIKEMEAAMIQ